MTVGDAIVIFGAAHGMDCASAAPPRSRTGNRRTTAPPWRPSRWRSASARRHRGPQSGSAAALPRSARCARADNYRVITSHTRLQQCRLARARMFCQLRRKPRCPVRRRCLTRSDSSATWQTRASSPERPGHLGHPGSLRRTHAAAAHVRHAAQSARYSAISQFTSPQLGLMASAKSAFHLARIWRTIRSVQLSPRRKRRNLRHCANASRKREDSRLHGIDDRFVGRSSIQRRAKPVQSGVVWQTANRAWI